MADIATKALIGETRDALGVLAVVVPPFLTGYNERAAGGQAGRYAAGVTGSTIQNVRYRAHGVISIVAPSAPSPTNGSVLAA